MFDDRRRLKIKEVQPGDQILIKQTKSTIKPPYDPKPYTVVKVDGNRIDAKRNETTRQRDKNSVKVVKKRPTYLIPTWERGQFKPDVTDYTDLDIEGCWQNISESVKPQEYSDGLNDEVTIDEAVQENKASDVPLSESEASEAQSVIVQDEGNPDATTIEDEEIQGPVLTNPHEENDARETEEEEDMFQSVLPESPVPSRPRPLKKGDTVAFKYNENNEDGDKQWHTCTLSRQGARKIFHGVEYLSRRSCREHRFRQRRGRVQADRSLDETRRPRYGQPSNCAHRSGNSTRTRRSE